MQRLVLSFLGPTLLTVDGESPDVPLWAKTVALLAYLAVESDRPHRREVLSGLLWPEQPDTAARNSLRQALHQLRRAFGEGVLLVTAQTVQFDPASGAVVDVAEFRALMDLCQQHVHRSLQNCRACVERLERAVAFYRGDLLAGFFLKDSVAFEEWALLRREQLRRLVLTGLEALTGYYGRRGDYERMEQLARRQVELDPFREEAHRQLMRALAWRGRTNAALAHYASLQQMLDRELGAPPEDQTTELGEQIGAGSLPALPPPLLRNWPAPSGPLVGREGEVASLAERLNAPGARLLTVVGPGGIGKTRLALAVGAEEALSFAGGACFVPLAAVSAPEFMASAVVEALGLPPSSAQEPKVQLREYLRDRDMLLLLDNLEHLLAGGPLLLDLLAACPRLKILATSREPLHLRLEEQFPVPPLPLPDLTPGPVEGAVLSEQVASSPAVELFLLRARAVCPNFTLDDGNAAALAEICIHLDGLPLAIELAAARVQLFSPQQMLARLASRLSLLVDGARDLPARQRTMRATLDWSYSLLTEAEKQLFARLAAFAGGCTVEMAQSVCSMADQAGGPGDLSAGLQSLLEKGLLQRQDVGGEPRLKMLETVHEYARERLAESGEQALLQERHAACYLALLGQIEPELKGGQPGDRLAQLEREQHNLRAALTWAIESARAATALKLCGMLWLFWYQRGYYGEGRRWLEAALALAAETPQLLAQDRARVFSGAGVLAGSQGDYRQGVIWLQEALHFTREAGDQAELPATLAWLGWAAGEQGDYALATACYEESLALARARGPSGRRTVAFILNALGELARQRSDATAARSCYEESLALWQELENRGGTLCAMLNLGSVAIVQGDMAQAETLLREALSLAWESNSQVELAVAMINLANLAHAHGQATKAAGLLGRAESLLLSLEATWSAADRAVCESTAATIRLALGEEAFAAARAKGRAMSVEEAVRWALKDWMLDVGS